MKIKSATIDLEYHAGEMKPPNEVLRERLAGKIDSILLSVVYFRRFEYQDWIFVLYGPGMNRNETKNIDNELIVVAIIALVRRVIKNARPNKMNCGRIAVALTRNIVAR
jgi:hypothetical protein